MVHETNSIADFLVLLFNLYSWSQRSILPIYEKKKHGKNGLNMESNMEIMSSRCELKLQTAEAIHFCR